MANSFEEVLLGERSNFRCKLSDDDCVRHGNRKVHGKMRKCRHHQLQHSLLEMNDCVRELSFGHLASRCSEFIDMADEVTEVNLVRQEDRAILEVIANTVSAFCGFPSSPLIKHIPISPHEAHLSLRPPCYGKESSPVARTSPIDRVIHPTGCSDLRYIENTERRPFHRTNSKTNRRSFAAGLKKAAKYLKIKASRNGLVSSH